MKNLEFMTICLTFVLMTKAYSYKVPMRFIELDKDPTTADTLVVGTLKENKEGEQYLITEKGWTVYPAKINIPLKRFSRAVIRKQGTAGEKQLYYSVGTINTKGELDSTGYEGVIPLNTVKAKEIINKLANKKDFVGEINPSWQFCESDIECVQSKNLCGKSIGVNKKYQKNYLDFLKLKKIKTECSKDLSVQIEKIGEPKCVENFCSARTF
jgi:hypothetical protein